MDGQLLTGELPESQLARLQEYLLRAKQESPFYRRKLAALDVTALRLPRDLGLIPFTTRDELSAGDAFAFLFSGRREVQSYYESSGTLGDPVPAFPDLSIDKCRAFGEFLDRWMRLSEHRVRRVAVALPFELSPAGIRVQMALSLAGFTAIPIGARSVFCSPARQLDVIQRLQPQAVFGRPMELLRLADGLLETGVSARQMEVTKLFFTGEVVSPAKGRRLSEVWDDAEVFGQYGLSELDAGLQSCAQHRYHEAQAPAALFEVIDAPPELLIPREEGGELVVSALREEAMPLFRYRTGDVVIRHRTACPCGSRAPSYTVKGRIADARAVGQRVLFPYDLEQVIYDIEDIGNEYQFFHGQEGLLLRLEKRWGSTVSTQVVGRQVTEAVHARLGVAVQVRIEDYGGLADKLGIARAKSGRFTDVDGQLDFNDERFHLNCVDRVALSHVWSPPNGKRPS